MRPTQNTVVEAAPERGEERGVRTVGAISVAPIKSFALVHPNAVELRPTCVVGDKNFFLVDDEGRLCAALRNPSLLKISPELSGLHLALRFPDGTAVAGEIRLGRETATAFYTFRTVAGNEVVGPWSNAISEYLGKRVRLIKARDGDGYDLTPVTIVSDASLERLTQESGLSVDHRRFRMLFRVTGCEEHEEDRWNLVAIGDAIVRIGSQLGGPVPRCDVVARDPDTAERNFDALRVIKGYRGRTKEGVVFGVYATIEQPGRVKLGDPVEPIG